MKRMEIVIWTHSEIKDGRGSTYGTEKTPMQLGKNRQIIKIQI